MADIFYIAPIPTRLVMNAQELLNSMNDRPSQQNYLEYQLTLRLRKIDPENRVSTASNHDSQAY